MSEIKLTLTGESAAILTRLTVEGGFASPESALEAVLAEHSTPDVELERWLVEVGARRFDAHQADPSRAVSVAEARARLLKGA